MRTWVNSSAFVSNGNGVGGIGTSIITSVTWGGMTLTDSYGNSIDNFAAYDEEGNDRSTPEPATIALLTLGGLLLRKRRA